jgi:methylenetetrahydrofolate reductase (NADPH)
MSLPALPPPHPGLSYELYPPRNPDAEPALWRTIRALEATRPDFVSVTYGADGSNRNTALTLLRRLLTETTLRPLAHLTCVGSTPGELTGILDALITTGVRGILALRGDEQQGGSPSGNELHHANELVSLIRSVEKRWAAHLCAGRVSVGVAAYSTKHPDSPSFTQDIEVLLAKEAAGADFAITQVFFHAGDYSRLVAAARRAGLTIPIIPGVMPFTGVQRLDRLSGLAGIEPDPDLRARLAAADDDAARRRIGVRAAVDLARAALDAGAPGIHLYTFNQHAAALDVLEGLQLHRRPPGAGPSAADAAHLLPASRSTP